jgi:two-component system, response regulator
VSILYEVPATLDARAIVIAEDDQDDRDLTREAFAELKLPNHLAFCNDGADLLDYLQHCAVKGRIEEMPAILLIDLNMPRICGRQALRLIRANPQFRDISIVMLSTSHAENDRIACYADGADLFLTKPSCFRELVALLQQLEQRFARRPFFFQRDPKLLRETVAT